MIPPGVKGGPQWKRLKRTPDGRLWDPEVRPLAWVAPTMPVRLHRFLYSRRNFFFSLAAAAAAYLLLTGHPEMIRRTMAVFVFAAACWMLEVFPIYITGLMIPLPITLLGIFPPDEAFAPFSHPVIFMLLGGLVLGQAMSKHGLDRRLAYRMIIMSRGRIDRLVAIIMFATGFISMWMSNTVAIAMTLPIVLTILSSVPDDYVNFKRKVLLGVTMSTAIGGMAMLTGGTPNMIGAAALENEVGFGFAQHAYYGLPIFATSMAMTFLILRTRYPSPDITLDITSVVEQMEAEGPMTASQKMVVWVFGGTIFLWFLGSQTEVWLGLSPSISSAAIVSILSVLVMFGLGLLDMKDVTTVQWELIFLLGGGILLGEAMLESGTAARIGSWLASQESALPVIAILFLLMLISMAMTNFLSNSATAAMLTPIAIETAYALDMNPVPFVMAIVFAASLAFITPYGTPSSAMVYATGKMPKAFMVKNGLIVAMCAMVVILGFVWFLPVP
ncbi:MAG: SLC13 family permease [Thermoplasmata archaeon]|nr:SLC13 family permease [Thermoplasmata archaeon]